MPLDKSQKMDSTSSSDPKPSEEEAPKEDTPAEDAEGEAEGLQPEEGETAALSSKELPKWQKKLNEERKAREEAEKERDELREKERQARLSQMSDTERLQAERDEAVAESYKLKIRQFAMEEVNRRKLSVSDPLIEIVVTTPWTVPPIQRVLGDSPTWEEVKKEVEAKLPAYLDSLVKPTSGETQGTTSSTEGSEEEPPIESTPAPSVDTERSVGGTQPKRVWSEREIAKMDVSLYKKYKPQIDRAVAEGRIVP